jgi:tRNA threonylcarbamoyladenosine biosynthesis protein TsaE
MNSKEYVCKSPSETFELGERIAARLVGGMTILLYGGLGAGKTLLTKGILHGLAFDIDEVTSPSFTLVNLYKTQLLDVYHIDLWRLDGEQDVAAAVGLDEIFEDDRAVAIVEWAERLRQYSFPIDPLEIRLLGDGDEPRIVKIES